ncbi:MAG TPA: M56 family metallopeptidase [Steroidobacteraceae bacterium]|nr:M56 family metallopeptidase [Steroidobacteraceae bacterium]
MSAGFLDHLWQSTLFAICAWLVTRLLRNNGAHLRHGVWLVASLKFLIPFSLLAMMGEQLQPIVSGQGASALPSFAAAGLATLLTSPGQAMPAGATGTFWSGVAGGVWLLGFLALAVRWLIRWNRAKLLSRTATSTDFAGPVRVMTSPMLREPAVVGIFRPVLLLPTGIERCLSSAQLRAILDHELCHVRRHDNLTASFHMLVEALFWFHPLVWWIGARLIEERERACDEAVVHSGNDPHVYAAGILEVCRSYVASDLACVSGVSGADLKTRLEGIMQINALKELNGAKRFTLGVLALAVVAAPVFFGLTKIARAEAPPAPHAVNAIGKISLLPGKRVSLDYQSVDVRALIRAMGDAAQVNILVSDQVTGRVTVKLAETSWEKALDIILDSQGLVAREKDGILFIEPAPGSESAARNQ